MSKEQVALWMVGGRLNSLESKATLNQEAIVILNDQVDNLEIRTTVNEEAITNLSLRTDNLEIRTTINEEAITNLSLRTDYLETIVLPVVYGSFSSTETQPIPADNSGIIMSYDTTDIAQGCSITALNKSITVNATGVYRILFSIQADRTDNGANTGSFFAFPLIDGNIVPNSATQMLLTKTEQVVMTVEFILSLLAGQNISIKCYSATSGQRAIAYVSNGNHPAVPSIILTLNRIG